MITSIIEVLKNRYGKYHKYRNLGRHHGCSRQQRSAAAAGALGRAVRAPHQPHDLTILHNTAHRLRRVYSKKKNKAVNLRSVMSRLAGRACGASL